MTNRRAVAFSAVAFALAAPLLASCDSAPRPVPAETVQTASAAGSTPPTVLPVAPSPPGQVWIVPHDCAPGAPPASIAAAFDIFKLRCDPERAEQARGAAAIAALATRGGALRGTAGRAAGAGAAAARMGNGGGSVTSGYSTSDVATLTPLSDGRYEVVMTDGNRFVVDQIRITDPRYGSNEEE